MKASARTHAVDLLVIGSGAGGLTAALAGRAAGLDVLVVEKHSQYGGSSAMSGGVVWVPNNHLIPQHGLEDSAEAAFDYLCHFESDPVRRRRLERYVRSAPEMARFLADGGWVPWVLLPDYPDYFAVEGHRPGGRTLCPAPLDGRRLGARFAELRPTHPQMRSLGTSAIIERSDDVTLVGGASLRGRLTATWRLLRWVGRWPAHLRMGRDPLLTLGAALVGHLRLALASLDVPLWLGWGARELLRDRGRVVGARLEHATEGLVTVRAKLGVVLAAGGFERNDALRARFLPQPTSASWSAAHEANTGDALLMAEACGAKLDGTDQAVWCTTTLPHAAPPAWPLIVERCAPGCILVDRQGRRFVDETAPFKELGDALLADPARVPCYLVFDRNFRRRFPAGAVLPGMAVPDWALGRELRRSYLVKAGSFAELEGKLGIPNGALGDTVTRYNAMVASGRDEDFHAGESPFARNYGLADPDAANPLEPLRRPPYYALRVFPGDLGTLGGPATDEFGQVVDGTGSPISGLYAVGNCAAPLVSESYPSSGLTLGAAMTWGFVAANHAAGREAWRLRA